MNTTSKRKIDIVVKYFYPVAAGIEVNILETYKVLAKKGWAITIHTSNLDYTTGKILSENEIIQGLKVIRYPLKWPCFQPRLDYKNTGLICLHNFDILPHLYLMVTFLVHKLTGKKTYKTVLTPHGGFNPEWRVFSRISAVIKYMYQYSLGVILINSSIDAVRAVSEWEKVEMIKKGIKKEKIEIISNGLEDEAFENIDQKASPEIKEKVKSYGKYLLQIGRIYPIKNYETTIKALPSIPNDINYVIVGPISSKKYLDYLKNLAISLNVSERVIFAGIFRGIDKYYLIKHATIMVHMALYESFGNVLHETLSQGTPIIAADNTAINFLIKDGVNGFLVETRDSAGTAEKINYVLNKNNAKQLEEINKKNIEGSKDSSWAKTAGKMDVLYSSLLNKMK